MPPFRSPRRGLLTRLRAGAAILAALAGLVPDGPARAQALVRLDHLPVAVRDLDAAAADYQALGFALKPGRPHANGLRNAHIKFANGAGLELITATTARDELSAHYVRWLAAGEGPAFMSLHAADEAATSAALQAAGIAHRRDAAGLELSDPALAWLFFSGDNRSPTDRPEHFAHANGACATREVWVALDDSAALKRLLIALGSDAREEARPAPLGVTAQVFELAHGSRVVVVGAKHQLIPGRPLIGVVLAACTASARAWPPSRTHGLWLAIVPHEPR